MNFSELHLSDLMLRANGSLGGAGGGTGGGTWGGTGGGAELAQLLLLTIHEPSTIALATMYSLSFIVGFVGNLLAIRMLACRRAGRAESVSATRSLLVNLAACDLMVVCVCMPVTLGHTVYTAWVYGDVLCRAAPFVQALSVSASVLSLTVISVNRYYSVHSPLNARSYFTRRRIHATIGAVWALSSTICMPLLFMVKLDEILLGDVAVPICRELWPHARLKQVYNVLLFVALYCVPVTFNLTISFLTGRKLWMASQRFSDFDPHGQAAYASCLKTRKNIAKVVVALVLLFAISWLPLYAADILIDRETAPPPWVLQARPFAQWLGLTNSSLNPICYCFLGDLHRSAKVFRTRYQQRMLSLIRTSSSSKLPRLLSLRRQPQDQTLGAEVRVSEETLSDWCSHTSVGDSSQMLSLHSLSDRVGSRSTPDLPGL
ncbi:QRFP-like peptide receptor [Brachyhypopomus gauderio]|uniref:QRFP-like peptide receptor n=1 Tax=Brachyhypopomus gauderio TaxID=698409 RepID=UPI00404188B0